jgi:hypothetical protein
MKSHVRRLTTFALCSVTVVGLIAPLARAQFQVFPDPRMQQAAAVNRAAMGFNPYAGLPGGYGLLSSTPVAPFNPYVGPIVPTSPYGPTPGYSTNPYYPYYSSYGGYTDPLGGYMTGAANAINALNTFQKGRQEALLLREQVYQARIETRRRQFEEAMYYRANTPTLQEEREKSLAVEIRRAQTSPTMTEVWSATSLNYILDHARKLQVAGSRGPTVAIEPDVLKKINVTSGKGGNVGLLKNEGQLSWPQVLQGSAYEEPRKRIEQVLPRAIQDAAFGKTDPGTLQNMTNDLDKIQLQLAKDVFDLPPTQYIESMRYIKQLHEALKALRDPEIGNYLGRSPKFAAKGQNAAAVIKYMAENGLKFAPAVAGDEAAYIALYNALVAYDLGLQNGTVVKE